MCPDSPPVLPAPNLPFSPNSRRLIPLSQISFDQGTQTRHGGNDLATVRRYAEEMQTGLWDFERSPLPLLFFDGRCYYPGDGHHRLEAARLSQLEALPCEVCPGSLREAQFFSNTEANKYHGKQLTRQDKRHRVQNLLVDPEWTLMSDREIARYCGVSAPFVGNVRKSLIEANQITASTQRKGKDGRVRETAKIGRVKSQLEPDFEPDFGPDFGPDYETLLTERNALMQRIATQQMQHAKEIDRLTAESLLGRNDELEEALATDEVLLQKIYDGLGTIAEALHPDRPAHELRKDVQQAARGIALMRRILEAQIPALGQDEGV